MGLSEEDKKSHPYFREKQAKEEIERWKEFTKSPEYLKTEGAYHRAVEEYLHQLLKGDFYAKDLKKTTVEQVVSATSFYTTRLCDSLIRTKFYLGEKMLKRFDLVKKAEE